MSSSINQASSTEWQTSWVTRHQHAQPRTATNGMSRGTCTWVQSGSSHKVASRLCGSATGAQLDSRTSGPHVYRAEREATQCPYCNNKRVCLHNSLATIAPDAIQYWNHNKNEKAPEQVVAGSNAQAEWKCPVCKLEWQARIDGRTRNMSGCPKCSLANNFSQPQPTFAEAQPACLAEWEYERNDAKDIYPDKTTLGSGKLVHWICSCCPRGQPHHWIATPQARVRKGSGCAVCAGHQACVCNSLESLFPALALEFDVDRNDFAPSEITAQSHQKVWWRNAKHGSWRQAVHRRTDRRNELFMQQVQL